MDNSMDISKMYGISSCSSGNCGGGASMMPGVYTKISPDNRNVITNNTTNELPTYHDSRTENNTVPNTLTNTDLHPKSNKLEISDELQAIKAYNQPFPITPESMQYLNGFMRTQIGRRVEVEFLVGSNNTEIKSGFLIGVGANYILLNDITTNDLITADFYNIKFMRFFY